MICNRLQNFFKIKNQFNKSIYFRSYTRSSNEVILRDINEFRIKNNNNNNNNNNNDNNNNNNQTLTEENNNNNNNDKNQTLTEENNNNNNNNDINNNQTLTEGNNNNNNNNQTFTKETNNYKNNFKNKYQVIENSYKILDVYEGNSKISMQDKYYELAEKAKKNTLVYYFNGIMRERKRLLFELTCFLQNCRNPTLVRHIWNGLNGISKRDPSIANSFLKYFGDNGNPTLFRFVVNSLDLDQWDSDTWDCILYFEIKRYILNESGSDKNLIDKFIKEIRIRKVEFNNQMLSSLLNYYMFLGDLNSVKFHLKQLKVENIASINDNNNNKEQNGGMSFPFTILSSITKYFLDINPLETINIIKSLIQKNGTPMLEDINFIQLIHTLVKSNRSDEFLDIWQSIPEKSKSLLVYNRVIAYFALVDGNIDFANIFLEKLMQHHKPNFKSIEPILIGSIKRDDSLVKLSGIIKTMNLLYLDLSPAIIYWHFRKFPKPFHREKMVIRLLHHPDQFARVFVVCDRINDEEHIEIKNFLLDSMAKTSNPNSFLDAIIYEYLYADDFQSALSYYTIKVKSFESFKNNEMLLAFAEYHKKKDETELVQHFKSQLNQPTATNSQKILYALEKKVEENFKNNFLKKDRLDSITQWLSQVTTIEESINQIGSYNSIIIKCGEIDSSIVSHKNLIYNSLNSKNNLLEKILQPKKNSTEIKFEFEKSLESQRLPPLETLFKMLDTIYLSDPSGFLSYIVSLNTQSSVLLLTYCYSTIIKFDIEYGLVQMEPAFKATSLTMSLWSALLINSIRQGYYNITSKILYFLKNSRKLISNQALLIFGQEIQNIRFKKNNINFNYNENVKLDYYEISNNDASNLFNSNQDGKFQNYYLNNFTDSQVNDLYKSILNTKVSIFSLYQKIDTIQTSDHNNNNNNNNNINNTTDLTFNHYFTPFKNSCIGILIDTDDLENANLLLSRLIESGYYNRATLLLAVEILRKSKKFTNEPEIIHSLKSTLTPLLKSLNITNEELYHLTEDPNVFENSKFIRPYLSIPQINEICELRNQTNSYSVLVSMNKACEEKIFNLIETCKAI
ncbi:hypothetical protein ACTFIY_007337 [Dictyostelium cf. discoideum]